MSRALTGTKKRTAGGWQAGLPRHSGATARGYVVPEAAAHRLRSHFALQAELHGRAVPLSVAAETLRTTVAVVEKLLREGGLVEDDRAHDQRRMVTRDSLEAACTAGRLGTRSATLTHDPNDLVSWPQARALAGLSDGQMDALVADGTLTQVQYRRRRHVTATSLSAHVASAAPRRMLDALQALQDPQSRGAC